MGGAHNVVVIGAGSVAITAADQGAQVARGGSGTIRGTCVNVGCVPPKTLIRAAETLHNARAAVRLPAHGAGRTERLARNHSPRRMRSSPRCARPSMSSCCPPTTASLIATSRRASPTAVSR